MSIDSRSVVVSLAQDIDLLLPQTQCTQCGYDGCAPYARAVADGRADINQCPPGGAAVVVALAGLLKRESKPLDLRFGITKPRAIATIDENICIGCTLCIKACPVDAIVGASKQMHTVIGSECTGCELCLAPCPVDCIVMRPPAGAEEALARPEFWRRRRNFHLARVQRDRTEKAQRLALKSSRLNQEESRPDPARKKSAAIEAAQRRARARQNATKKINP